MGLGTPDSWLLPPGRRVVEHAYPWCRRVVCTMAQGGHRRFLALTVPSLAMYARRWGWDLVVSTEALAPERPASWAKVRLVSQLLRRYETVFWVDADAIVVDPGRDVTAELTPGRDLHVIDHAQPNAPDDPIPNFGVFLVRRSAWSLDFLDRLWRQDGLIEHNWWENAALLRLLGYSLEPPYSLVAPSPDLEHIGRLSLDWNCVPGYMTARSAAIHHHARADHGDFARRLAAMAADLEAVVDGQQPAARWRRRVPAPVRRLVRRVLQRLPVPAH